MKRDGLDISVLNATRLNVMLLNYGRLNTSIGDRVAGGLTPSPGIKGPVSSYRCYDKTNDDEDRDVLKDLSGNGHDIQLYNFAFSGGSGYGKYAVDDFNSNWSVYGMQSYDKGKYHITFKERDAANTDLFIYFQNGTSNLPAGSYHFTGFKYRITNPGNHTIKAFFRGDESLYSEYVSAGGVYTFPSIDLEIVEDGTKNYGFQLSCRTFQADDLGVTFEIIPDYRGALVSDGVDDYGLCGNFPILTKEKGYTVVAIRKWINDTQPRCLLSTHSGSSDGAFQMEKYSNNVGFYCFNFGASTGMQSFSPNDIVYQTSRSYNGNIELAKGSSDGTSVLNLFRYMANQEYGSAALYALEIYGRDLTEGEIAKVKERMIAEYEEKTGNTYEEETA